MKTIPATTASPAAVGTLGIGTPSPLPPDLLALATDLYKLADRDAKIAAFAESMADELVWKVAADV
jgi:hypothetical protein